MTDLTDRMRTCAAFLLSLDKVEENSAARDAADLLIEASILLEAAPAPLGEPMEAIPSVITQSIAPPTELWVAPGGPLPGLQRSGTISRNACPQCDSRAAKRVHRQGSSFVLECPVCGHAWKRT